MIMSKSSILVILLLGLILGSSAYDFSALDAFMEKGIADKVTPGAVVGVANEQGLLYVQSYGNLTFADDIHSGPVSTHTLYDMASCTKVLMTTSAVAIMYERGDLTMTDKVSKFLGAEFNSNGKDVITMEHIMTHSAGFFPDPVPNFSDKDFGCPETSKEHPQEVFTCGDKVLKHVLDQPLMYVPGVRERYSDLSMITAMFVVGTIAKDKGYVSTKDFRSECASVTQHGTMLQCYYEAFVKKNVLNRAGMRNSGFLPSKNIWKYTAPTWQDDEYRHARMWGQVSDENAYAMGGIAGHAGLFSNVPDIMRLLQPLMFGGSHAIVNATTMNTFRQAQNLGISSRAIGWDTNNYKMNHYRGCGNMSSNTYTHLGYTGTQVCNDPDNKIITVLLTNRCSPEKLHSIGHVIKTYRQGFNNHVLEALGVPTPTTDDGEKISN